MVASAGAEGARRRAEEQVVAAHRLVTAAEHDLAHVTGLVAEGRRDLTTARVRQRHAQDVFDLNVLTAYKFGGALPEDLADRVRSGPLAPGTAPVEGEAGPTVEQRASWLARRVSVLRGQASLPAEAWALRRDLTCPVDGATFGNDFHFPRSHGRRHLGTDVFAATGTPVVALADGEVLGHVGDSGNARPERDLRQQRRHRPRLPLAARLDSGRGPGLIVIQEWWGLTDHIKDVTDLSGAVDFLLDHDGVTSSSVGAVGFCIGGGFVLVLAATEGERIGAAVPYYGVGGYDQVDLSKVTAPVLGHFGSEDEMASPDVVKQLESTLQSSRSPSVDLRIHEGAGHAFSNDENHLGTYDPELARSTWPATVAFLKDNLS